MKKQQNLIEKKTTNKNIVRTHKNEKSINE